MKRWILALLVMLAASPGVSSPRVTPPNGTKPFAVTVTFLTGDTEDSEAIPVSGFCTVRYQQASGDDASLYSVPTADTATGSGTLIASFTASTTSATTFTAGTRWVKAVATDATAGGSVMTIECAPQTASGSGGGGFDACRTGTVQGGGYDVDSGRWSWTCGNYNWHGWRDSSQVASSYTVSCTGDGTPHTSCFRDGETRYINYGLHRIALAAQYTKDGGYVYLPEGIYVDGGAGVQSDGTTRAKMPQPYDPEYEARSYFSDTGYPTMLATIVLNRGVRLVGEGIPDIEFEAVEDSTVTENRPRLTGTWVLDDRGTADGNAGVGNTLDGEGEDITAVGQYRLLVGGNRYTPYCSTTSNTDATCDRNQDIDALKVPGEMYYWGVDFETLADVDTDVGNICVPDADSIAGTTPDTGTGMCSGNRLIRCWDTSGSADVARSSGGCDFGDVSYGTCQSPYDALVADYQTNGNDLQLAANISQCVSDASSSTDCRTDTGNVGHSLYLFDLRAAPGGTLTGGASCAAGAGTNVQVGLAKATTGDFTGALPFQKFYVGTGVVNRWFPVKRGALNGRDAGFEGIGRMPANWWSRNSSTSAADCLSGSDIDDTDDETACDTDTLSGFALSHGNRIGPNNLFAMVSQAVGNKSGVIETYPSGGPNYFEGNRILRHFRGTVTDWGTGYLRRNIFEDLGAGGTAYTINSCFSDGCRFEQNEFKNVYASYLYLFAQSTANVVVARNIYENVRLTNAYNIIQPKHLTIENEMFSQGYSQNTVVLNPGVYTKQKPAVTIRGLKGLFHIVGTASNATTGGGAPQAIILVEGDDGADSLTDEYRSLLIDDVHIDSTESDDCLVWFEDDVRGSSGGTADSASLARESAVRATIRNSSINGGGAPAIACTGQYEYTASVSDSNSPSSNTNWAVEAYSPRLVGNIVNGTPVFDQLPTIGVTQAGDAGSIPHGTVVRVHNGSAACAHTSGVLDSGSAVVTCASDQAADTWTEWP